MSKPTISGNIGPKPEATSRPIPKTGEGQEMNDDVDRLREWLAAIRQQIRARGAATDLSVIEGFATAALEGKVPHWFTDEYRAKVARGKPRPKKRQR